VKNLPEIRRETIFGHGSFSLECFMMHIIDRIEEIRYEIAGNRYLFTEKPQQKAQINKADSSLLCQSCGKAHGRQVKVFYNGFSVRK
jgi:hypothetical protein